LKGKAIMERRGISYLHTSKFFEDAELERDIIIIEKEIPRHERREGF
jgi:hypothetical protein